MGKQVLSQYLFFNQTIDFSLGASRFVIKPTETDVSINIIKEILSDYKNGNLNHSYKKNLNKNS